MSSVVQQLFKAILDINSNIFNFNLSPMFPLVRPPINGQDPPPQYKRVQTVLGIVREFTDLLRTANWQWKPTKSLSSMDKRDLAGRVAVVTGADDGIGRDIAVELTRFGFKVIMGVTDVVATEHTIEKVKEEIEHAEIKALKLDSTSLASVRLFADVVTKQEPKIDLLINSADEFTDKKIITKEGFEKNFVENYLSHFLLTRLMLKSLVISPDARIVNVSSTAHHFGTINLDDLNQERVFLPFNAYNQSKLAQVLFTRELSKRLVGSGINVYAVNPGVLRKRIRLGNLYLINEMLHRMSNTSYGAQAVLYIALEEKFQNETGHYYSNYDRVDFLTEKATDPVIGEKLWNTSSDFVKQDRDIAWNIQDKSRNSTGPKTLSVNLTDEDQDKFTDI